MRTWVDIGLSGHNAERHRLAGQAVVGRCAPAKIVVSAADFLEPEHFSLVPQPQGCWVELSETAPEPFTLDGRPSRGTTVPWGSEIFYGRLRLSFVADKEASAKRRVSPVLVLGLLAIPLVGASLFLAGKAPGAGRASREYPPMFGVRAECSEGAEGALERALIAQHEAMLKNERGVFELADAVEAVQRLREAMDCFVVAGHQGDAARLAPVKERWIAALEKRYQRARLDLTIAQRSGRPRQIFGAVGELGVLLRYSGDRGAEFREWLEHLGRKQIASNAARKRKED